ncbi:SDR family oxidoreductase [Polycladidibacter hongkongensis]|uniref:SDR family oxidoreductase n=1 Tax=Polycladidibacter hongkongensis TaxID=1647556 RepID=UPI000834BBFA|nr:SDR family oxidoreductase [Pseudovibrio hongkongensis]
MRLFIFGCGFSAKAFVQEYSDRFDHISGTSRSLEKCEALRELGIDAHQFNGALDAAGEAALHDATHVLISIAPDETGDPVLKAHGALIAASKPEWIGYLSTVGVYGDHQGAWVYEDTPCYPVSERSHQRLIAEQAWQRLAKSIDAPLAILRLSGIYGPGRNAFVNLERGTAKRIIKKGQVFNRIHCEDIAGVLAAASAKRYAGVLNVSDHEPAPPQDVVELASQMMGVEPPPAVDFESADMSPMARSFYGEVKRINSEKVRRELQYSFRYPTYREALAHMWAHGWK